jgi:hypothetical protein
LPHDSYRNRADGAEELREAEEDRGVEASVAFSRMREELLGA